MAAAYRGVVQADTHVAVVVALVAEGVLDAHLVARRRVPLATVDGEAGILALELVVLHRLGADEVRHRLLTRRAEGVAGRLGRLEEDVAVPVAVELASRLAGRRDVVAAVEVHLGDGGDLVGPQLLSDLHLLLGDRRGRRDRRRRRHVGHRRVVQKDAHLSIVVALVAEGVVDVDLVAGGRVREGVVAHGLGGGAVEVDLVVVELNGLPAAAAVDGEAGVLASVRRVVHRLRADEIGHGALASRTEGVLGRLGRLEEDVALAVAVELASRLAGRRHVVTLVGVHLGDGSDLVGPQLLRLQDLGLRHRRRRRRVGDRRVVQENAALAVFVLAVAEGVLDAHLVAGGRVREDVVAHGHRGVAHELDLRGSRSGVRRQKNRQGPRRAAGWCSEAARGGALRLVVAEDDLLPTLATVDGEAGVLALELVVTHRLGADEVRHRLLGRGAEGVLRRLGRLEEDVGLAVAVQLASGTSGGADEVAAFAVDRRDDLDGADPVGLCREHLLLADSARGRVIGAKGQLLQRSDGRRDELRARVG
eukprot:scaffold16723_cov53-Phaeocystis_antarctica.AAC.1